MNTRKVFPTTFFWGAATAAYQVEGGIENNDWAKAAREGRVPVAGRACDHYNRYEEDFDLAKKLGHNAHRFSIEWARIEPEEGRFDEAEIEHYRKVLRALRARNLEPFLTLWHFTVPQWFADMGGFEHKKAPEYFARYARFVMERLGDTVCHVSTMNEPNVFASQGWINGEWPPFKVSKKPWQRSYTGNAISKKRAKGVAVWSYFRVMNNLATAHRLAYKEIKQCSPHARVSIAKHIHVYLKPTGIINRIHALLSDYFQNHRFTKRIVGYVDEIGINFYQASQYGIELTTRKTDMGWNYTPERIFEALTMMKKYNLPLFVSEAGIADAGDANRAEYIQKQVAGVRRAIEEGVQINAHFYWSLMDNYEWALGTSKRFGLIEIDYDTLERKIRPSAYVYKELIERSQVG